ncbi:hypothetical protein N9P57_00700 [Planktomarina temperata]|nr:hypothetical protein [Planktomarina temperata]
MIRIKDIVGLPTLEWHLNNKRTLSENVYRYSSESFIQLFTEARQAWRDGKVQLNEFDEQLLRETDIGLYGEYKGQKVPLDLPMESINEAEYQGKEVPLNKPKRGGSKKFYVYVKNKKGNVQKVSFGGTTGLNVKIDEPGARSSFAARHKCATKKDKTKPGYWSCNIGRYWKSLGGSRNFSGYW